MEDPCSAIYMALVEDRAHEGQAKNLVSSATQGLLRQLFTSVVMGITTVLHNAYSIQQLVRGPHTKDSPLRHKGPLLGGVWQETRKQSSAWRAFQMVMLVVDQQ